MIKYVLAIFSILPTLTFAMFCPTNFKSIDIGDTLDFVLQECGFPTTQYKYEKSLNLAQSWDYYIKSLPFDPATTKLQVLFKDDKIVNIQITESNSISTEVCESTEFSLGKPKAVQTTCHKPMQNIHNVANTTLCGSYISVGDNTQKVESICGKPAIINQINEPQTTTDAPRSLVALKYDGPNPATLVFENGRLIERVL